MILSKRIVQSGFYLVVGFLGFFPPGQLKLECSLNCLGTMLKPFAIYYIAKSKRVMQGLPVLSETFDVCAKFQWMMTLTGFSIKKSLK